MPKSTDDDEAVIVALVRREGGRARTQAIIEETGWNPAKVSRLLKSLESEGRVHRVSVGREKIVCLPESTPSPPQELDAV